MSRTYYDLQYQKVTPGTFYNGVYNFPGISVKALLNGDAGAKNLWTIGTPATVDNSAEYVITLNDTTIRFTTDATATQAELASGLYNAFLTNAIAGSYASAQLSGTDILITANKFGESLSVSVNSADTTNDLTATETTASSEPNPIPFGYMVGRTTSTASGLCRLITANTDIPLGIALAVRDIERNAIGSKAKVEYGRDDTVDVCDRTDSAAVNVVCVESDIDENDTIYISVASGHEGKVTKTASGNIDISAYASFQGSAETLSGGQIVVPIRFNKV